jgi:hypothetical protein
MATLNMMLIQDAVPADTGWRPRANSANGRAFAAAITPIFAAVAPSSTAARNGNATTAIDEPNADSVYADHNAVSSRPLVSPDMTSRLHGRARSGGAHSSGCELIGSCHLHHPHPMHHCARPRSGT